MRTKRRKIKSSKKAGTEVKAGHLEDLVKLEKNEQKLDWFLLLTSNSSSF